jgi:hypothetical protein
MSVHVNVLVNEALKSNVTIWLWCKSCENISCALDALIDLFSDFKIVSL